MSGADDVQAEMLAALDARSRSHGAQLDELAGTVTESAGYLATMIPRFDELAEHVAELRGRAAGAAGGSGGSEPVRGVVWETLTAEQAGQEWDRLGRWVADVLGVWYELRRGQLPDCWALHRPVVRRLSALHTAYVAAYSGPAASASAVVDWHDRWLPGALRLIGEEEPRRDGTRNARNCAPGRHDGADAAGRPILDANGRPDDLEPRRPATDRDNPRPGSVEIPLADDPIHPDHWGPFWSRAVHDDVAWRRVREGTPPE